MMVPSTPWDYPPELRSALATLETLWNSGRNPLYAWRAVGLCLLWTDDDGKLTGPFQPPLWCLKYLAVCSRKIMGIACGDAPTGADHYQRLVMGALGLTAPGRNAFRNWRNENMLMAEAGLFDAARSMGHKPAQIYQVFAEGHGVKVSDNGKESERRKRQDRVTKGRRILTTIDNTKKPAR